MSIYAHSGISVRPRICRSSLLAGLVALSLTTSVMAQVRDRHESAKSVPAKPAAFTCKNTVTAKVVALEQTYYYNRTGSFNPAGLIYALRRDVVPADDSAEPADREIDKFLDHKPAPSVTEVLKRYAGNVKLRSDKRPRPLVLRVNEGDCLKVIFTNLLSPVTNGQEIKPDPANGRDVPFDSEEPETRHASMHVNGLELVGGIESDGSNVGVNPSSLAAPGETRVYTWYAKKEGGYLLYSMAAPAGGEGDGGQLGLGLFGSVNVEPRGSRWYRSQVTATQLAAARNGKNPNGTPRIRYDAMDKKGVPILAILNSQREIVHSDLNAVIDATNQDCHDIKGPSSSCGRPFRELTAIFHDEVTAEQAFPELEDETNPIAKLKDGMAINYGAAGMGAMVLSNRKKVGPSADCAECKLEEFFLSSWAMGDPAMVVRKDQNHKAVAAFYPDDPSNVHHSYLGDPVRFRNLHAGPKETHVFHLHAHQWLQDWHDPNSVYLDSQTISPGASFTYEIQYGGSGNRNFGPGDSIFHCHLYPHFAQGMWELWRSHDVFEAGTPDRNLPDAEIAGGTPNPAIVPLPHAALPPMPTHDFKGYPFYIAGKAGHRPPQPPYDMEKDPVTGEISDGGLPRHLITYATRVTERPAVDAGHYLNPHLPPTDPQAVSSQIAVRVQSENGDPALFSFAAKLEAAKIEVLPYEGTEEEQRAMRFHAGLDKGAVDVTSDYKWPGKGYPSCDAEGRCDKPSARVLFTVNGRKPISGAPFSDPCPDIYEAPYGTPHGTQTRNYRAAYVQFDMPVNKSGWHDPQARIITLEQDIASTLDNTRPAEPFFFRANSGECVVFHATNLMPSNLNLDDFQVFSPTDTIGQHIHLVKFDVTSSDGSANGWNYEDATFAAEEVRERIEANNLYQTLIGGSQFLKPKMHRLFWSDGALAGNPRGVCLEDPKHWNDNPWCGAQTSLQRWWADPLLNDKGPDGKDRTIRTVFTHDHLGPSSHQQHGLYAALVIEPPMSVWETLGGIPFGGTHPDGSQIVIRKDGGPTSYAASILTPESPSHKAIETREFNLAFADFALMYDLKNKPVNPPNRLDHDLPNISIHGVIPRPEGISSADPGGQLLNYRNEPIPLRIAERDSSDTSWQQRTLPSDPTKYKDCEKLAKTELQFCENDACVKRVCNPGDLANVFSSSTHVNEPIEPKDNPGRQLHFSAVEEPEGARQPGDPGTPLLTAYEGDHVQVRLIQGAQEENHIFTMHGAKWLSQPESMNSGYMNGQQIGISEHFEFDVQFFTPSPLARNDYLYSSSGTDNLWDGQWGLLRVLGTNYELPTLKRLASNPRAPRAFSPSQDACRPDAKTRKVEVTAFQARDLLKNVTHGALRYNDRFGMHDPNAILFVLTQVFNNQTGEFETTGNEELLRLGKKRPEPLILRARADECVIVTLVNSLLKEKLEDGPDAKESWSYNMMPPLLEGFNFNQITESNRVSLHPQLVAVNNHLYDGAFVGLNRDSTARPDGRSVLHWYAGDYNYKDDHLWAGVEFGVVGLQDKADVIKHASHGAIGALVIEPDDATWETDCQILNPTYRPGGDMSSYRDCLDAAATVHYSALVSNGHDRTRREPAVFREFVVIYQDDVSLRRNGEALPNLRNGDDAEDSGQKAFNYRSEPLWGRLGANPAADPNTMNEYDYTNVFRSPPDPATPLFTAEVGMPVRFRVVEPAGHPRNHGFTVFGHDWILNPWSHDSTVLDSRNPESANRFGSTSGIGPARHVNILIDHAGGNVSQAGSTGVPGDYMYRTQEGFMFGGGLWGIFRVLPKCDGRVYEDKARPSMVCK